MYFSHHISNLAKFNIAKYLLGLLQERFLALIFLLSYSSFDELEKIYVPYRLVVLFPLQLNPY
jgi:hypothetical protein